MSAGRRSTEYKCVQSKYSRLTGHLKMNKQDLKDLFDKFIAQGWHGPGDCPGENALINIALQRIQDNPTELKEFIEMLEQITGMNNITNDLKEDAGWPL